MHIAIFLPEQMSALVYKCNKAMLINVMTGYLSQKTDIFKLYEILNEVIYLEYFIQGGCLKNVWYTVINYDKAWPKEQRVTSLNLVKFFNGLSLSCIMINFLEAL